MLHVVLLNLLTELEGNETKAAFTEGACKVSSTFTCI